ncbi:MAG: hypothetical protein E7C62_00545 [Veillonella sp.]|nr:hypothetical protein [Veillonella sp.]
MEMLKRDMITVKDIKEDIQNALLEKPVEGEDFDDRYDRLHAEWLVKGLKKYRQEINDNFANNPDFQGWVTDIWGDVETAIAVINEELKLREIETVREAVECAELIKVYVSSESGQREEAEQKVIKNLEEGLNNHDKGVINLFEVEVVPLLNWVEELLTIKAYLSDETYEVKTFTKAFKNIYNNSFILLDTNIDNEESRSNAHPLEYYVNLEDEWEFLYLDDLNLIEELLTILPNSPYTCDILYYANTINKNIKAQCVETFTKECESLYKKWIV